MNQVSFNSPELSKYTLSVDAYDIKYNMGFADKIVCQVYIAGLSNVLASEYEERTVPFDAFERFVRHTYDQYDRIEDYMADESDESICDDLSCVLNMIEGRTRSYALNNIKFPETILN